MSELYNYEYYHCCCGPIAYEEPAHWVEFFGGIADRIVNDLKPRTVLDAGCAMGYLVAALRDRGVEAYGVDISEYAISKVREDIKQYCAVGSLTESLPACLPRQYDLVVTIEVLEHMYEEDGRKAIQNLCTLSDRIIFSSTPDDFTERTHFNVQQREYWARLFAAEGFFDDLTYRPTYLTAYASCFKKKDNWLRQIEDYERNIRITDNELLQATAKLAETQQVMNETGRQLGEARAELENRTAKLAETQQVMSETGRQLGEARAELENRTAKLAETQQVMSETGRQLEEARAELEERTAKLAETQQAMRETGRELDGVRTDLANQTEQLYQTEKLLEERETQLIQAQQRLRVYENQDKEKEQELLRLRQNLAEQEQLIIDIQNSFSWKITRPLYNLKTALYFWMEKRPFTRRARKAISILRRKGIKELRHAMKQYWGRRREQQQIAELTGIPADNSMLSDNYSGYLPYDSEYQEDCDFSAYNTDIKALAFYLPQFHTFPENDMWWGKGFTEWVNVRSGDVRFAGHYQPRIPHSDIGYYCLDDIAVLRQQAILAKRHGIYGFCFYYYWFSGKRLMEKPVDMLLEHTEIDLPFCLCWANENWTRAWDGQSKNILIGQEYSDDDDQLFMRDIKKYIDDSRYIRINGKPLILVYNPGQIPDCHRSFKAWRKAAQEIGLGEILIWTCQTANNTASLLKIEDCIDAEVEFPPHNLWMESFAVRGVDVGGKSAFLYNYQCIVNYIAKRLKRNDVTKVPIHRGCMMAWDNAARRKDGWFTYYAFSLRSLYRWVLAIADRTRKDFPPEEQFMFINAWNEWGEGTYLEPDEKYGYANINTVSKGLLSLPFATDLRVINEDSPALEKNTFEKGKVPRIAVQIHMFYLETLKETVTNLNQIPYTFDCFVSTDTEEKRQKILEIMTQHCRCRKTVVEVMQNRGRDVAPFLIQLAPILDQYDYIGHVHSKKTLTNEHGNEWRRYIFDHLFGSQEYLKRVFYLFEHDKSLGIIMPETYPVLELQAEWGGNRDGVAALLERMHCNCELPEIPTFPVGNMFWARTAAVRKIFELGLSQTDFPEESGQVNGTIAHQIERIWVYLAASAGYHYCKVFNNMPRGTRCSQKKRLGIFVHFDKAARISEDDLATIQCFSSFLTELVVVSNADLGKEELDKIRPIVSAVEQRQNIGFDFGAWRDALLLYGREKIEEYDELVLLNNSCFPPVFDIREMFSVMENKHLDFWGNTIFPYSPDGSYIHRDCILEHLQSYFLVFEKSVLKSETFWSFWKQVPDYTELIEVIANCESQLTQILSDAGFSYEPYIRETYYLSRFLNNYAIPYEKPTALLLLKDAFIKKKCYQHMDTEEQVKLEWLLKKLGRKIC